MNASLEIELNAMKSNLENQLRKVEAEAESIQSMLDEKLIELDEKEEMMKDLKKKIENLEADVTDKTKVKKMISAQNRNSLK